MGTLSATAVTCAALAGWLALGPQPASVRLRRIVGAARAPERQSRARAPVGRPTRPSVAGGLASVRARAAAAAAAGAGLAVLVGGAVGAVGGVVGTVASWVGLGRLEPAELVRNRRRVAAALPLAADLISAGLAAGAPPDRVAEAVGTAVRGPLGDALCRAAAALRLGAEPATAWAPILAHPESRPLGRALAAAMTRGSAPGALLERVAADSRDRARWEAEARARSLGARAAAPLGLCFLPAFVLVGIVPLIATVGMPLLP